MHEKNEQINVKNAVWTPKNSPKTQKKKCIYFVHVKKWIAVIVLDVRSRGRAARNILFYSYRIDYFKTGYAALIMFMY